MVTLQKRRDLMDGYVLAPDGATVADAIRSADISTPQNRQRLERKGFVILSRHNSNDRPADLRTEPPTLEVCRQVLEVIAARREQAVAALREELKDAQEELKQRDLARGERAFWRTRARDLEAKIAAIEQEEVSAEELHRAFLVEDARLRASFVPPEMREAMEAIERERAVLGAPA